MAKRTTGFLAQTSDAILEYTIATFVLVCPSRAGHMVGLSRRGFRVIRQNVVFPQNYLRYLCEKSKDRKIYILNEHCYIFICIGL